MIGVEVSQLPPAAIEFSKEIASLAAKYDLREVQVEITLREPRQKVRAWVSRVDDRGRPRQKVVVSAEVHVSEQIVWEPDSSN